AREGLGECAGEVLRSVGGAPRVSGRVRRRRLGRDDGRSRQRVPALAACQRRRRGRGDRAPRSAGRLARLDEREVRPMTALTPANQLTLLRMLLIPAFVILVVYGELGWALIVFVTAGITDGLDGLIARWSGQKTSLGAWLDPMADKLLLVTT